MKLVHAAVLTTAALGLAACGSSAAPGTVTVTATTTQTSTTTASPDSPEPTESTTEPAVEETTEPPASAADGTEESPYPIGKSAQVGDWTMTVVKVQKNATRAVADANMFNDKPKKGTQYVLVTVKATYRGSDKGSPSFGIATAFLGSDAREYSDSDALCVAPNDLSNEPDVRKGGTVRGNECLLVPTAVINGGGLIELKDNMSFSDEDVAYWRLP